MNQHEFELQVLRLWTTTRIPLTRANVLAYTGAPRAKAAQWLEAMVLEQLLELDSDDEGELLWRVRGAARSATGPRTVGEWEALERLKREVDREHDGARGAAGSAGASRAVVPYGAAGRAGALAQGREKKSLLASGLLSFFFGPLGFLYAAPLREAVPAIVLYALLSSVLPYSLLPWFTGLAFPLSGLLGVLYAMRYNQAGSRAGLFTGGGDDEEPPRKLPQG